jgi:glutaminyl-peptide cyclotransferase
MRLILLLFLCLLGCSKPAPEPPPDPRLRTPQLPEGASVPTVDGDAALALVQKLVDFGPRPSGTDALKACADFIANSAAEYGYDPETVVWSEKAADSECEFRNIYAELPGTSEHFVILGSHFDTKKMSSSMNFVGANDGGSSTGLLLEIMRVLKQSIWQGPSIKFAFFDGEEARVRYGQFDGLHGSRRMARDLEASGELANCRAMVLMDMVGDSELGVTLSPDNDKVLIKTVLAIAEGQGTRQHFGFYPHGNILDDHLPFQRRGVPAIDIIDFAYGPNNAYWHTSRDTMDKVSAESLRIVGNVVLELLLSL